MLKNLSVVSLVVLMAALVFGCDTANASGTHTTWTAVGERVTAADNSTVFITTPVNVTGFKTKALCDSAIANQNNLTYPRVVGYNKPALKSMVVAVCVEVTNEVNLGF